jgi:hypothetical protein
MTLVDERAFGSVETTRAVSDWHEARERAVATTAPNADGSRRLDLVTGSVLIALSVLLFVGSLWAGAAMGRGAYFIAIGPLFYGIVRLTRAGGSSKPGRAVGSDEGPYRKPDGS